jgi:uncharacterized protein (TIGR02246 family)
VGAVTQTDEGAVRALYRDLLDAWNRRDAHAYAGLFADDGQLVGFDGAQVAAGQIVEHFEPIFKSHPTAAYVAKVRAVRALGPDAALLRAIAGMIPPGQAKLNPAVNAVQSMVAERHDGSWRVVFFQNTAAQYHGRPDLAEQHTAELAPLVESG